MFIRPRRKRARLTGDISSSKEFCAPKVDQWLDEGPTNEQLCSECMLHTYQAELNSPLGYDSDFADYYSSLTAS